MNKMTKESLDDFDLDLISVSDILNNTSLSDDLQSRNSLQNFRLSSRQNSKQDSTLNSEEGSTLNSEEGSTLNSKQDSILNSEEGSTLNSEEGSTLNSKQDSTLNSEQDSTLNSEQGTTLNSERSILQNVEQISLSNSQIENFKNPISLLQESCAKQGRSAPCYVEKSRIYDSKTNNMLFQFEVTVDDFSAVGPFEPNKQLAKRGAVLAYLEMKGETFKIAESTESTPVKSSIGVGTINYVGCLQELCVRKQLPPPRYGIQKVTGPPHSPVFYTFCEIGLHFEVAMSNSKKFGKQLAAEKILECIEKLGDSFESRKESRATSISALDDIDKVVSTSETENLQEKYNETVETNGIQIPNPVGYLQELCVRKQISPPVYGVEKVTGPPHSPVFYTFCEVGIHRQVVTSNNKKSGKELAARKIIRYLKEC